MSSKIPKIIVMVDGGIVQEVLCDRECEIEVLDFDTEGMDSNVETLVPLGSEHGGEAIVYRGDVATISPKKVNQFMAAIAQARK